MAKEIKVVNAASISRILNKEGYANGKGEPDWCREGSFEVCQGGWKGRDKSYAQVFFQNTSREGNAKEIVEIAEILREAGYYVEINEQFNNGRYFVAGEIVEHQQANWWITVRVENAEVAKARQEVERIKAQLAIAEAKFAQVIAEVA